LTLNPMKLGKQLVKLRRLGGRKEPGWVRPAGVESQFNLRDKWFRGCSRG